jgi:hypothetical protein
VLFVLKERSMALTKPYICRNLVYVAIMMRPWQRRYKGCRDQLYPIASKACCKAGHLRVAQVSSTVSWWHSVALAPLHAHPNAISIDT